jgi:hypothetical protein
VQDKQLIIVNVTTILNICSKSALKVDDRLGFDSRPNEPRGGKPHVACLPIRYLDYIYGNFYLLLAIKAFNSYQIPNMQFTNSQIL